MDDKKYTLPTVSWNAKITRVYKVENLKSIRIAGDGDMKKMVFHWHMSQEHNKQFLRSI